MNNRWILFWILPLLIVLVLTACSRMHEPQGVAENQTVARKITPADLRFDPASSTAVISSAQKFILPVPRLGFNGEPLVYPKGHEKAGTPILDYEGKPVGKSGLVFLNAKDQSWQAVAGDGEGVIIINEVTQEQAEKLNQKVTGFQSDPNQLTLAQLKQVLDFAQTELKLADMYNSTRSFVKAKMTPVTPAEGRDVEAYGLKKRDDRDVCHAVYIPGKFVFEGPAASPQVFDDGGVIVEQGGKFRGVQPDVFMRTYRLQDGRQVASLKSDLKVLNQ